ncbi:MAG: hypothetical protein ABIR33_02760 [Pyrinomonadaceae bacterium]
MQSAKLAFCIAERFHADNHRPPRHRQDDASLTPPRSEAHADANPASSPTPPAALWRGRRFRRSAELHGVNSQDMLKLQSALRLRSTTATLRSRRSPFPAWHDLSFKPTELNRLINAGEIKNSVQRWERTFTYDRFGNRHFNEAEAVTLTFGHSRGQVLGFM